MSGIVPWPAKAESAINMRATMYSDGTSCPGDCDAHVVLHPKINGTRNAFRGGLSDRVSPTKCQNGEQCNVCFGEAESTCLTVLYRGNGPHSDALDFTPAFFEQNCAKPSLPTTLARICRSLSAKVEKLRREHVNCIANNEHPQCTSIMAKATRRKEADTPFFEECKALGESAFNQKYRAYPVLQRRHACAYSDTIRRSNSAGKSWVVLLPAACRAGTHVGRDGLDCCSSSVYAAAGLHDECRAFFPARKIARTR